MREDPDEKTVFKIKLRREHRELWMFAKILGCVISVIASIGMLQIYFCREKHEKWTVLECLRP